MNKRATFTQAEIKRAVKGAIDAGMKVGCVEVDRDGTIRLLPESPKPREATAVDRWFDGDGE